MPTATFAGAFIWFIWLLQYLLSKQPEETIVPDVILPIPETEHAKDDTPIFRKLRWDHPFFEDMQDGFSDFSRVKPGKYAWKVRPSIFWYKMGRASVRLQTNWPGWQASLSWSAKGLES